MSQYELRRHGICLKTTRLREVQFLQLHVVYSTKLYNNARIIETIRKEFLSWTWMFSPSILCAFIKWGLVMIWPVVINLLNKLSLILPIIHTISTYYYTIRYNFYFLNAYTHDRMIFAYTIIMCKIVTPIKVGKCLRSTIET